MAAALALGRQGLGRTAPNPSVGAVVVRPEDGRIVGLARTADGGRPHAEVQALAQAGEAARGATVYVTLEPCSHHGRTPPCADALVAAGVARVVVAARDPNPLVAGEGIARLTAAGIAVTEGVRREEAERDLAGHISRMRLGRPFVRLKMALSAEGAIGRAGAGQVALTGPASNAAVHLMRAESDAIMVGVGTVLADDPRLTVRLPGMANRSPLRVIVDTHGRTPPTARLFADPVPVLVAVGEGAQTHAVEDAGAQVLRLREDRGRVSLSALLSALSERGITTVMVEAGAALAEALAAADLVDEAVFIETPRRMGAGAILPFGGGGAAGLAPRLAVRHVERRDDDRWVILARS